MSDIRKKIEKILAKAKSTNHAEEAALFMEKAQKLMEKHQISAFDLGNDSDPIGMTVGAKGQSGPSAYKTHLQHALAWYYGCRSVQMEYIAGKWEVHLVGPRSARITTILMTDFIWKQCNAEARKIVAEHNLKKTAAGTMQRKIINALLPRIRRLAREAEYKKKQPTTPAGKNALIVLDKIKLFLDKEYGELTSIGVRRRKTSAAARDAANSISLHRQTESSANVKKLL